MRLAAAASYFDGTLCKDALSNSPAFFGQLDLFDDSRRDGVTVPRRVLSTSPDVVIPPRRVLTIANEQWMVGTHEADSFKGATIRDKHILQRADGAATIYTLAQVVTTGGTATYGAKLWVKDMKELEVSSKLSGFFNIYLPSSESVSAGNIVGLSGKLHIVRNTFLSAAGFLVAESDELDASALVSATFKPQTYTPATDTVTAGTPVALKALRTRFQDDYVYLSASAMKMAPGDIRAFIGKNLTAAAPKASDILTMPDGDWLVMSVSDESTGWGLHLRRAPG